MTGVAASQYISGLVHDSIPLIEATAKALEMAKQSPEKSAAILNSELERVVLQAMQAKLELGDEMKRPKMRKRPRRD